MADIDLLAALVADPGASKGLQRGIYAAAGHRGAKDKEALLLNLLKTPEMDPQVDAAIGKNLTSAALTRAWLSRPGRTADQVAAAASDRRVTIVAAVATVKGLSADTYRTCAKAGNFGVTLALCRNLDVDDDIILDAVFTTKLPSYMSWSKTNDLGSAFSLRPAVARAMSYDKRLNAELRELLISKRLADPARIDEVAALAISEHPIPVPSGFSNNSWTLWRNLAQYYNLSPQAVDTMVKQLEVAAAKDAQVARTRHSYNRQTLASMVAELRGLVGAKAPTDDELVAIDINGDVEELIATALAERNSELAAILWHTPSVATTLLAPLVRVLPYHDGATLAAARPGDAEALGLLLGADRLSWEWRTILDSSGHAEAAITHAARFYSFEHEPTGFSPYGGPQWLDTEWLTVDAVAELRPTMIAHAGSCARVRILAREMVSDRLGDDPGALALLAGMVDGYQGSFSDLLDAVTDTLGATS